MRRTFNLDQLFLQEQGAGGYAAAISSIATTRGDTLTLQIGAIVTNASDNTDLGTADVADVRLVVKEKTGAQRFDDAPGLSCLTFAKVTLDGQPYYQAQIPIAGDAIDADLGVGAPTDVDEVTYSATVSLVYSGGRQTCAPFDFIVRNNYDRGESSPPPRSAPGSSAPPISWRRKTAPTWSIAPPTPSP